MEVDIRALTHADELDQCAAMMVSTPPWSVLYFTKDQCRAELGNPEVRVYGAISDRGALLGFVAAMPNGIGFEPMLEYLCVTHGVRNRGIGSKLISYFETALFPSADNLYLFVSDINPHAIRLYERLGYERVGTLPNFNLPNQTEYLYRKTRRPRQAANAQF